MLSRVAERLYWMARYLERAENAARIIGVYDSLLLDLPRVTGLGWRAILPVFGDRSLPPGVAADASDVAILRYLLADPGNPASLLSSLAMARENARTTRDVMPSEAWRAVNELTLHARARMPAAVLQKGRDQVLRDIVARCQHVTGMLDGTMSHGDGWQFMRLGRNLERADMSSRTIDLGASLLLARREELGSFDNTLWMAVLRCLSAYQMYRQYVRRRICASDVIGFLLRDPLFPRALAHCLAEAGAALHALPQPAAPAGPAAQLGTLARQVAAVPVDALDAAALNRLMDELQLGLAQLHGAIRVTWFAPEAGT
jgi:uncharacterized alpha-E superfamily protein